jgi:hypothetical protein
MSSSSTALRSHLTTQLNATVARRSYDEIFHGVPAAARGVRPEGLPESYSLWQILEHMRICQLDYYRFCTDPEYTAPTWPDDYWPDSVAPPGDDAWTSSVDQFRRELQAVVELVNDASIDLAGDIPHADEVLGQDGAVSYHGATYADEIASIADHNAYHLGQFVTVRRLLDVWPPEEVEPPEWVA